MLGEASIGDLVSAGVMSIGDGYRTKQSELRTSGFRMIRVADVKGGQIALDSPDFVSAEFGRQIGAKAARVGDVLLTTKGTVGRVAVVPELNGEAVYSPQLCWFRVHKHGVLDHRFFSFWLSSAEFIAQASYLQSNTDMAPYISLSDLQTISIALPPLPKQQAIAEVLGALDDKIAANTALAASADQIVRAEYLAVPAAETVRVADIANSPRVAADPSMTDPDVPYVGLEHIPRRSMWLSEVGRAADVSSGKSQFLVDDVLFGKLRPYFHKVISAPFAGICSTDVLVVRAKSPWTSPLLLAALSSDEVVKEVVAASGGTRMPRTSWKDLAAVQIAWPGQSTAEALADRLAAVRAIAEAALVENRTLAATRDALLPQLMSGKLRVRDAEAAASEAGA